MPTSANRCYRGRCLSCGDEWTEHTAPAVCPECHSLDVEDITVEGHTELEEELEEELDASLRRHTGYGLADFDELADQIERT